MVERQAGATANEGSNGVHSSMLRVLFIHPGAVPPPSVPERNVYHFLSERLRGALLTTTWLSGSQQARRLREETLGAMGAISLHALPLGVLPRCRSLRAFMFYLWKGVALIRTEGPYDAVVAYGIYSTGLAGLILARLGRAAFVVDVPGHPYRGFEVQRTRIGRVKAAAARRLAPLILDRADGIKLLYPTQLDDLRLSRSPIRRVFHEFTPVSSPKPAPKDAHYILLLGYPWYLKGVDVLIRAFLQIAEEYPLHRLLVVGHCPDRTPFEKLANGHPRIELRKAIPHEEAEKLIANCSLLAVPSRTEAMGRVILEAYSLRKPVVASRVDGIPTIVSDGTTGLLALPEDVSDLARQLRRVLGNPELAKQLGEGGYHAVRARYNEQAYAHQYAQLIEESRTVRHRASQVETHSTPAQP